MLNRRYIRIKVMQSLYALEQAKKANYGIALELIEQHFTPAWNDEEGRKNKDALQELRKTAQEIFSTAKTQNKTAVVHQGEAVKESAQKALTHYRKQVAKDSLTFQKNLFKEAERIYNAYLSILLLLSDLNELATHQDTKLTYKQGINLANNSILKALKSHESFQKKVASQQLNWNANRELVKNIYRKVARNNEKYEAFLAKNPADAQEKLKFEKELLNYVLKNVLFEHEGLQEHFENLDLSWEENHKIIKSMLSRTLKDISTPAMVEDASFSLSAVAKNWEDDQIFLEDLYEYNVENEPKLYAIIEQKAKNWEMERLALTDQIILKMAVSEMLYFFSIPIKVSINEYIEISKLYSTPKSKQFINGLLDRTAQHLQEQGKIKKSGRGLLDNK